MATSSRDFAIADARRKAHAIIYNRADIARMIERANPNNQCAQGAAGNLAHLLYDIGTINSMLRALGMDWNDLGLEDNTDAK